MPAMLTDLRDVVHGLRTGRGTTALAFAILTLTLAAGTVTFSVVDAAVAVGLAANPRTADREPRIHTATARSGYPPLAVRSFRLKAEATV